MRQTAEAAGAMAGKGPRYRYIKLGKGNAWATQAMERGEIPFSRREVPHELALTMDRGRIAAFLVERGSPKGAASAAAREVIEFYGAGSDTVWITFVDDTLRWARAAPDVTWLGESEDYAPRMRKTINGWHDTDAKGQPLLMAGLSTRLTKVASFRQTICGIEDEAYLARRLAGELDPDIASLTRAQDTTLELLQRLIAKLHWADFETLIDIILDRGGWHRTSALGGTLKDADLLVEHFVLAQTAFVQVKSEASQAVFERYLARYDLNPLWSRFIFACHSPSGELSCARDDVMIWTRRRLAELVFRHGLVDWIVARSA